MRRASLVVVLVAAGCGGEPLLSGLSGPLEVPEPAPPAARAPFEGQPLTLLAEVEQIDGAQRFFVSTGGVFDRRVRVETESPVHFGGEPVRYADDLIVHGTVRGLDGDVPVLVADRIARVDERTWWRPGIERPTVAAASDRQIRRVEWSVDDTSPRGTFATTTPPLPRDPDRVGVADEPGELSPAELPDRIEGGEVETHGVLPRWRDLAIIGGGGFEAFTGRGLGGVEDGGPAWQVRALWGSRRRVGAEVGYAGSAIPRDDGDGRLVTSTVEAAARVHVLRGGPVTGYAFAGAGWRHLHGAGGGDLLVTPVGAGVEYLRGRLRIDARVTARPTPLGTIEDPPTRATTVSAGVSAGIGF